MISKRSLSAVLVVLLLLCLQVPSCTAAKYGETFSKVPWQQFPGGQYKASTTATLKTTTIAGSLIKLKPGGMRELHWHSPVEWAMVIEGACMLTVVEDTKFHPSDTWNLTPGDVWYIPANMPHAVLGLAPMGCNFVSGFKDGGFDELTSMSASNWLPTVPVDTLALSLGISKAAAQTVLDKTNAARNGKGTFMPQGDLKQLLTEKPSLPVQLVKQNHRFPLMQDKPATENADGSIINLAAVNNFPVSTEMCGALLRIATGGMRQLHWHLTAAEWVFVINGTVECGVFTEPGTSETFTLGAGDVGFFPIGSGHYIKNSGKEPAHLVLIFDVGKLTTVDINNFLGSFPPSWVATSLGVDNAAAREFGYTRYGFAPAMKERTAPAIKEEKSATTSG